MIILYTTARMKQKVLSIILKSFCLLYENIFEIFEYLNIWKAYVRYRSKRYNTNGYTIELNKNVNCILGCCLTFHLMNYLKIYWMKITRVNWWRDSIIDWRPLARLYKLQSQFIIQS